MTRDKVWAEDYRSLRQKMKLEQKKTAALLAACRASLPLLIRLGDFIGNGEGESKMERCDAVLAVREAIALARFEETTP